MRDPDTWDNDKSQGTECQEAAVFFPMCIQPYQFYFTKELYRPYHIVVWFFTALILILSKLFEYAL